MFLANPNQGLQKLTKKGNMAVEIQSDAIETQRKDRILKSKKIVIKHILFQKLYHTLAVIKLIVMPKSKQNFSNFCLQENVSL